MLLEYLNLDRINVDDVRDIRLTATDQRQEKPALDMFWIYQHALPSARSNEDFTWSFHRPEDIRGNVHYLCDWRIDVASHTGEPFATYLPEAITTFLHTSMGESHSAANALVHLWLTSGTDQPGDRLYDIYRTCMILAEKSAWKFESRALFLQLITRQLGIDQDRLTEDARIEIRERLRALGIA